MRLPYISPDDLPKEVREKIEGQDYHWESLHEEDFLVKFPVSAEAAEKQKRKAQIIFVAYRKYVEETKVIQKKLEKNSLTEEEASELMQEAYKVYASIKEETKKL